MLVLKFNIVIRKLFLEKQNFATQKNSFLRGHFSWSQAKTEVEKIKNPDFSYWA